MNNILVELRNNGAELTITLVLKIVQYVTMFFSNMDNHVMEGLVSKSIPNFTPCNANPKYQAAEISPPVSDISALKVKPGTLPLGTPACK